MKAEIADAVASPAADPFAGWAVAAVALAASLAVLWTIVRRRRLGLPAVEPRPHPQAPWTGADVAAAVITFFGLQVLAVGGLPADASLRARLAAGSLSMLAATGLTLATLRSRGISWPALRLPAGRVASDLRLAVAALCLLVAPLLGMAALLDRLEPYRHVIVDFLAANRDPLSIGLVCFAAVVAAPIAEEVLFRGLLQGWLETLLGGLVPGRAGPLAIAFSSAAFALAHLGQGLAWLPLFFFGWVAGYLALQTGSLLPGIILHALFNAVSVVMLLLQSAPAGSSG
jgi:membrane protease YdiL (CAAX protease family)